MVSQPEKTTVEQPLIDQLERLGWSTRTGNPHEASATGRESFRDVLLEKDPSARKKAFCCVVQGTCNCLVDAPSHTLVSPLGGKTKSGTTLRSQLPLGFMRP